MQRKSHLEPLWQDRDIRFDASSSELALRLGEQPIEIFTKVEDTKGNTGEVGRLVVTNLRLIWQSLSKPRINLSIGFNNITTITARMLHTKLRGRNEALYMMTKVNGTRYEFIFIRLEPVLGVSQEMVELVGHVCRAYTATRYYRDLKLRSAIMSPTSKHLKMLHSEQIYNSINGVWNLSSDQGNLGMMILTNVRVVWVANMNELFNISIPYIQIRNIKVRESKFGLALVIESSECSGGYVLGFRVDPVERLNSVYEELNNLYVVHSSNPDFGVRSYLTSMLGNLIFANNGGGGEDCNNQTTDSAAEQQYNNTGGSSSALSNKLLMSTMLMAMTPLSETTPTILTGNNMNNNNSNNITDINDGLKDLSNYVEIINTDDPGINDGSNDVGENPRSSHTYSDPVAAYLAEGEIEENETNANGINGASQLQQNWVYLPELGLSIEKIRDGYTLESLWEVVEH